MITIGNQFGGPEQSGTEIYKILNLAGRTAAEVRLHDFDDGSNAWINPIFIVPGSLSKPDFTGIKKGHFSSARKGLVLAIAVPDEVVSGEGLRDFVVESLRACVVMATKHFASKGIPFCPVGAEKIIATIERKLAAG